MHSRVKSIAVFILALVASSCVAVPRNDAAELRAFVERFLQAVNASNTDDFVACFAADATAFFPSSASAARHTGIDQIRKAVQPVFAQGPRNPPALVTDLLITEQDSMAVASFDARAGATHSRRTLVLQRVSGEWKIVHLHASNVIEGQ